MKPLRQPLLDALRAAHVRLGLVAVIAAGVVLTLVSFLTLRNHVEQNLSLIARSISYAAEAATVFEDSAAAAEVLTMVADREGLLAAAIDRADGTRLAEVARAPGDPLNASLARLGTILFPLQAGSAVMHEARPIGQVTVQGNGGVYLLFLLQGLSAIALCTAGIVWLVSRISRRFERDVVDPLNALASLTRRARTARSFSLRARPAAVKEIHDLGQDVNALLAEIESHQAELVAKHDTLKTANESLSFLAFHDSLTGLPNRASFLNEAARAMFACRSRSQQIGVLYVDSDNFKSINDGLGHAAGDELLVETARRIRSQLREGDLVARLGGDEFAVLLAPIRSAGEAARMADRIAQAIRAPLRRSTLVGIEPSASIGVAVFPNHGSTVEQLLLAADAAMYRAKTQRAGSFEMFDAALDSDARDVVA